MRISIDVASPVPVFEQLRIQIVASVERGDLPTGARLPSVRQLAKDLDIAPGTVARAYQRLEEAGVTTAHRRHGTRVAERTQPDDQARRTRVAQLARDYVASAARLGVDGDIARALVLAEFDREAVRGGAGGHSRRGAFTATPTAQ